MLSYCQIQFDPISHTYTTADGEARQGITAMLHRQLFPDMYSGISEDTLNTAAERGKHIHALAEFADEFDLPSDDATVKAYRRTVSDMGWTNEASEYIVTDGKHFASPIDKVYRNAAGDYVLADIKTTYTLNKEYVRWQLSVYAYLFELCNPDLEAGALFAVWLREGKCKAVEVQRIDSAIIASLLQAEIDGKQFINPLAPKVSELPAKYQAIEAKMIQYEEQLKELKNQRDAVLFGLRKEMERNGVKKWESDRIRLTYIEPSVKQTFDTSAFRAEHPDLYERYVKQSPTKPSLRFTIK